MGDVVIGISDDDVRLREAQLFRVEAVNGALSGLPGDKGKSWRLALGVSEQSLACDDCLVARFEGDIGRSLQLGNHMTAGAYIGGALQDNRNANGNLFVRGRAFVNASLGSYWDARAVYENRYHIDGDLRHQDVFALTARYSTSGRWDARLSLRKNVSRELTLGFGYYW